MFLLVSLRSAANGKATPFTGAFGRSRYPSMVPKSGSINTPTGIADLYHAGDQLGIIFPLDRSRLGDWVVLPSNANADAKPVAGASGGRVEQYGQKLARGLHHLGTPAAKALSTS